MYASPTLELHTILFGTKGLLIQLKEVLLFFYVAGHDHLVQCLIKAVMDKHLFCFLVKQNG